MAIAPIARTPEPGPTDPVLPETVRYRAKKVLLGRPLVTSAAKDEKLSKKAALGVLSSDCISSAAYGSEQMLISLLAVFGLAGFHILMPMTAVVLVLLVLMTAHRNRRCSPGLNPPASSSDRAT